MPPTLHLIRHGHGFHNIPPESRNKAIHDPSLTLHGRQQSTRFSETFPADLLSKIDLICASPLKRTLQTAMLAFAPLVGLRASSSGAVQGRSLPIIALPDVQEVNDDASNTGSPLEALMSEFEDPASEWKESGRIDWSIVEANPYWYRKIGRFDHQPQAVVEERARRFRKWIRGRPEKEVVVVGHGVFWHYVTGNIDKQGEQTGPYWLNLMWRTFEFTNEEDDGAEIVETPESRDRLEKTLAMR